MLKADRHVAAVCHVEVTKRGERGRFWEGTPSEAPGGVDSEAVSRKP